MKKNYIYSIGASTPLGNGTIPIAKQLLYPNDIPFKRAEDIIGSDGMPITYASTIDATISVDILERVYEMIINSFMAAYDRYDLRAIKDEKYPLIICLPPLMEERDAELKEKLRKSSLYPLVKNINIMYRTRGKVLDTLFQLSNHDHLDNHGMAWFISASSLLSPQIIDFSIAMGSLSSSQNPYGIIPSETAVTCLVGKSDKIEPIAYIIDYAGGNINIHENKINGKEIASAALNLCKKWKITKNSLTLYSDLNGLRHKSEEYGILAANLSLFTDENTSNPISIASHIGETGMASSMLNIFSAIWHNKIIHPKKGYSPSEYSLIYSSDISGEYSIILMKSLLEIDK